MNPVIDSLMNHRSIRRFKARPLEEDTLDTLLKAGTRAASAGNLQHYSLIVIDDPEKKKALWNSPAVENGTLIMAVVDEYRLKRWFELNDTPFYFDRPANFLIAFWDAVIALHNIVIAAESLGLGGVYLGEGLSKDTANILGTPSHVFPAELVCLGYPDETPDLRPRLPQQAVVHRNGYQMPTDEEVRACFKEREARWTDMDPERKALLARRGIHNLAQMITLGHYTEAFVNSQSQAILEHLEQAGFKFA
ncbi:MAG TPA: nitroreductase family protein [Anaerolineaceae bacterium]|nr:nitroreductase family protein [Anaerolineaceae bacterium]HPN53190.1 nitroreductase family protein [Anaerolineaceae bacterium]